MNILEKVVLGVNRHAYDQDVRVNHEGPAPYILVTPNAIVTFVPNEVTLDNLVLALSNLNYDVSVTNIAHREATINFLRKDSNDTGCTLDWKLGATRIDEQSLYTLETLAKVFDNYEPKPEV